MCKLRQIPLPATPTATWCCRRGGGKRPANLRRYRLGSCSNRGGGCQLLRLLTYLGLAAAAAHGLIAVAPQENLAVVDEGPPQGRVVVLVPGLSGCAYSFRKVTPLLHDQGIRTVIIEPLGLGLSDRPRDADYTLTAQAARLATVLDQMDMQGAVFVSQGVATSMVLRLALARPELVAGVISIEGGAAESAATATVRSQLKLTKLVAKLGGANLLRERYAENLAKASGDASWIDRRAVNRYFRGPRRDLSATLDALHAMTEQEEPLTLGPRLGEIMVPVRVLCGAADHAGGLEPTERELLARSLPDVGIYDVPDVGHFIQEERPRTVVSATVALVNGLATAKR
jgi:pimeloyl-ACP methyl ester carboxylesterase